MKFDLSQEILKSYGKSANDFKPDILKELERDLKNFGVLEWKQQLIDFGIPDFQKQMKQIQCLDELTRTAGRISSCIVPAMNLPDSFESLMQNPDAFTEQIQNIAALENTQYKNECVEVSEEDLNAIATSVGPEAVKDILNESDAQSSKQGKTTYKITVTKCIDLLKNSLIVVLSSLFLSAPAVSLIPNAEPISNFVNTVLSFTTPVQFFASLNEPNRLKK